MDKEKIDWDKIDGNMVMGTITSPNGILKFTEDGELFISSIPLFGHWVSVKDKLPEPYEFVLVYEKTIGTNEPSPMSIGQWTTEKWETLCNEEENNACANGDLFLDLNSERISHWMPLPKPPEEGYGK